MKRVSRACLHCRQRKSRCDLDSSGNPGSPPCQRCLRDRRDCVLGSSNRGGRRVRKKPVDADALTLPPAVPATTTTTTTTTTALPAAPRTKSLHLNHHAVAVSAAGVVGVVTPGRPAFPPRDGHEDGHGGGDDDDEDDDDDDLGLAPIADSPFGPGVLQNPSDAWQCLTNVAHDDDASFYKAGSPFPSDSRRSTHSTLLDHPPAAGPGAGVGAGTSAGVVVGTTAGAGTGPGPGASAAAATAAAAAAAAAASVSALDAPSIAAYRLVQNGTLTVDQLWALVLHYADHFHPHLPLVPRRYFARAQLGVFARDERHLLTAILTIASKNQPRDGGIGGSGGGVVVVHDRCAQYMHELIADVAAGAPCDVGAVEALLLIAEWEPPGLQPRIKPIGRGEENRAAWMHVGMALRSGYFLGLERTSFRGDSGGAADLHATHRRRLAWACCYVSDRLISVRIGRAFWSRGPGPMTGLVSDDFPSLRPRTAGDEDHSKILQATLDLTQLYGNVHDVLYSGMRSSSHMMLMGDYVKYVDDFRIAIDRWSDRWSQLTCAPELKVTLQMQCVYLSLYTNAFAFQAAISQTLSSKPKCTARMQREYLRATFSDVASMQDSRFIYASVRSAKEYLRILNTSVDPERHLRYLPLRYYLYGTYAAVFLYKAHSFGVISRDEQSELREMIRETMARMCRASAGPDKTGTRYALLLERLWFKPSAPAAIITTTTPSSSAAAAANTTTSSSSSTTAAPTTLLAGGVSERGPPRHPADVALRASTNGSCEAAAAQVSPANDFSWLDLEAVGDFVLGNPMPGANILDLSSHVHEAYPTYTNGTPCPIWPVDQNGNLLF
ncbi:hypothetical protein LOY97_006809 [Ophidiomyces ophidiicola]|nr:hypothetical protein LOZ49_006817 [Ophidiomyces ophidiicola]KAI2078025.1 hypothetical protein LOZ36_006862 [Ophidiomyces ophidiicola]KAI2126436.1 hypothetical protein LOZ29_006851 [Ophidiomyces ophidiicola]KAI2127974.1 hypothetical protein LOZ28_006852 [Ophidiomyces ophidiicola]KAI2207126.1 hypothetical protein LOZ15_006853 [Ophidiomyces ophidiicola]